MVNISRRFRPSVLDGILRHTLRAGLLLVPLGLFGCGGSDANLTVTTDPGPSPFISLVHLGGLDVSAVTGIQYTIAPKPGSVSQPVHVEYSIAALRARGYMSDGMLTVPVYGLYAGYENQVSMEVARQGGDATRLEVDITTDSYVDPSNIYSRPNVLVKRSSSGSLGFSFIYIKSGIGSPIILDTDGEIRWAAPGVSNSVSSALFGDSFIIGVPAQPVVYRLGLDGSLRQMTLAASAYTGFSHDIALGKKGVLGEMDASSGSVASIESNLIEMYVLNAATVENHWVLGTLLSTKVPIVNSWDLGAILGSYMSSQGDDASAFVRPGVDWFHINSAIYDPRDDSVIVSSRENFVIKLDYTTGAIKWILGDPTKYWYSFPSLRAKALTLAPGGLYPIGQHGLSITPDGLLMLFNDGAASFNQPPGEPAGQERTYSAVSAYSIDPVAMTAQEAWRYDAGQTIYSRVCSSAYESPDGSVLVDYAVADNATEALLVGLDPNHNVGLEFEYPTVGCSTSWNARPIALDDLQITQ